MQLLASCQPLRLPVKRLARNNVMPRAPWMAVVWPAFLAAGVLEIVVFAFIDPHDLHWNDAALPLSRQGIYTVAFFVFWGVTLASSALTALLAMSAADINN